MEKLLGTPISCKFLTFNLETPEISKYLNSNGRFENVIKNKQRNNNHMKVRNKAVYHEITHV
jgi:hypothetical protein